MLCVKFSNTQIPFIFHHRPIVGASMLNLFQDKYHLKYVKFGKKYGAWSNVICYIVHELHVVI